MGTCGSTPNRGQYATGVVDLTAGRPPRLLDVVPGRTGKVYADWIAEQEPPRMVRPARSDDSWLTVVAQDAAVNSSKFALS